MFAAMLVPVAMAVAPSSSAENCGRCHRAIFEAWKKSSHAVAMESRLFQDALELAETEFGAGARATCLGCHSPMAAGAGDLALQRKVSWEGVTCDYCHSIRDVAIGGGNPKAAVSVGAVKTGPLKDAMSNGHETQYSAVHTSAAICAPCHEYKNAMGFAVLTTYSEWKNSRYAKEGKPCQACHMSRVAGDVVDPRVKRTAARVNLHQMPGSHSLEQLLRAVRAQLTSVREGANVKVTVELTNQAAGHSFPTGSPLRRLQLEVKADSYGGQHYREERVYTRKVGDASGVAITREHAAFVKAARVLSDTRLGPGEKKSETFTFAIPAGTPANVTATLYYYYSPMERSESQQKVTFLKLNSTVR